MPFCSRCVRLRAILVVRFGDVKIAGTEIRLEICRRYFIAGLHFFTSLLQEYVCLFVVLYKMPNFFLHCVIDIVNGVLKESRIQQVTAVCVYLARGCWLGDT